ncbi:hypothetical protein [Actinophytocola sp. KF-1]
MREVSASGVWLGYPARSAIMITVEVVTLACCHTSDRPTKF